MLYVYSRAVQRVLDITAWRTANLPGQGDVRLWLAKPLGAGSRCAV
jgi:hypothetical protein